ncbi:MULTISPECIES: helix-turn-helix transcriptional regulator [unclassified Vibrio]|uniref:helix-turn-helix domain-containing protein n=1 Tax=unclassified Vibrio TaxID=2614977 RepID=UPI0029642B03|nr:MULTISPECIES: helix-turn-helix transcriptional regulator [unclassified Vibrio]MDW2116727.1 helix-turn-helix transcriptional regulator [Vibrio sp. 1731]MDW3115660.1 helix-turn-helix transcriptional regulator [Vibrio sp. 1727]
MAKVSQSANPLELLATNPVELSLVSAKSKMMLIVSTLIKNSGMTQSEAAEALGVSQPRISNLMNGKISKFSIDMLLEMLGKLGFLLDIRFDPSDMNKPISMDVKKTVV